MIEHLEEHKYQGRKVEDWTFKRLREDQTLFDDDFSDYEDNGYSYAEQNTL